jgi:hypothetical protein
LLSVTVTTGRPLSLSVEKLRAELRNAGEFCRAFAALVASALLGAVLLPTAPLACTAGVAGALPDDTLGFVSGAA